MQIIELPHFDYLKVSGSDSIKFLQGQLTCNVELLSELKSLPGAICNLQGRVIADFTLFKDSGDCLLQCTAGTGEKLQQTLARYAVFSKVELQLIEPPYYVYGVIGDSSASAFAEIAADFPEQDYGCSDSPDYRILRLPGPVPRFQLWSKSRNANARLLQLDVMEEQASYEDWLREEIRSGSVHVSLDMSEQYTPQLLNYDLSGVIDFKKGCYTGQEVVARMYYRGKPKKRLYLITSDADLNANTLLSAGDSPVEVLAAVPRRADKPSMALAILPTSLAEDEPASLLTEAKISVEILPMPYTE